MNQQWSILSVGGGSYVLINRASDKLADVSGASTSAGATVVQWPLNGGTNQRWSFINRGGSYTLVNQNSGLVLEVSNASTNGNAAIDQQPDTGSANQL